MSAKDPTSPQTPEDPKSVIKETCRLIRLARTHWKAKRNKAARGERDRALALYETLSKTERSEIPNELRVWLRYRSEKYLGNTTASGKTPTGTQRGRNRRKTPNTKRRNPLNKNESPPEEDA